ncbi:hypothetical protein [Halovenus aranensis]|uniref:hypothetical protein n=1 Tax=Halovenus aranensis TaxID=890420 RepID=UPI000B863D7F|nr:hypothetical protein [Halovenus aranensis]
MSLESIAVAAVVIALGAAMRLFGLPWLVSGMEPLVAPEVATEFLGDFLLAVGSVLVTLGLVDELVAVPEVVWLAFGLAVVLSVAATPKLAGVYVRVRAGEV